MTFDEVVKYHEVAKYHAVVKYHEVAYNQLIQKLASRITQNGSA